MISSTEPDLSSQSLDTLQFRYYLPSRLYHCQGGFFKTEQNSTEQGTISIHTDNIFPIIKKWLYSEKEIFLRELVSNAVDAIHKIQLVSLMEGLQNADDFHIDVLLDKGKKTITIKDNGIGMSADEIRRYINQIAFSSAEEFVEKFKNLEDKSQIIGHFVLGFYSAFMVAKKVEIRTLDIKKTLLVRTGHVTARQVMNPLK